MREINVPIRSRSMNGSSDQKLSQRTQQDHAEASTAHTGGTSKHGKPNHTAGLRLDEHKDRAELPKSQTGERHLHATIRRNAHTRTHASGTGDETTMDRRRREDPRSYQHHRTHRANKQLRSPTTAVDSRQAAPTRAHSGHDHMPNLQLPPTPRRSTKNGRLHTT